MLRANYFPGFNFAAAETQAKIVAVYSILPYIKIFIAEN